MKIHIGLLAATSALALLCAPAFAAKGGKPEKEHGASSEHGKSDEHKKAKDKDRDWSDRDNKDDNDCGLGRRDEGETGARDPWEERDEDCKAADDHGDHDGYGDREHGRDNDDDDDANDQGEHDRRADRDRDHRDEDDGDDADAPKEKKRSWRWPWERDN